MSAKDDYLEKARAQLDQWNAEIDKIKAKVDEAGADAKIEYQKQLVDLRSKRDEAEAKIKEIAKTQDAAWTDMKAGFDKAWDDMSSAFEKAMSRFR